MAGAGRDGRGLPVKRREQAAHSKPHAPTCRRRDTSWSATGGDIWGATVVGKAIEREEERGREGGRERGGGGEGSRKEKRVRPQRAA